MVDEKVIQYFDRWQVSIEHRALATRPIGHWVGAEMIVSGSPITINEPSTGGVLTETYDGDEALVDLAVSAARRAFEGEWGRATPLERQTSILRLADLIEQHLDELAFLECVDVGKPLSEASGSDIAGAVKVLRYFAGWATKISGRTSDLIARDDRFFGMTLRQPVGVVAAIAPWNFPIPTLMWKIGAALAAGCTIVAKPSELTPISTLRLAELVIKAGFPAGVFNVVNGGGATTGAALVAHPGVNKVSFTGSTVSGIRVGQAAMANMTRLTLELGGKSPALVFADSDLDRVVNGLYDGIFFNAGQVCDAASRAIIDASIYDEVRQRLVEKTRAAKLSPGLDPTSDIGPLVSSGHKAKVRSFIDRARKDGLGFALDRSDEVQDVYFVGPVILEDVPSDHPAWREEIFGPALVLSRAESAADILRQAKDTSYGLAAAVFSRDVGRVMSVARTLDAGTIYVNGHGFLDPSFPFGGLNMSGFGKDMGAEQMDSYLETKTVLFSGLNIG